MNAQSKLVYDRAIMILELMLQRFGPIDQITVTALMLAAAYAMRAGAKDPITRERWLASCVTVFDAAAAVDFHERVKRSN